MALVLQSDAVHPRVAWSPALDRASQARSSIHNGVGPGQPRLDPL
jgi:hypothetical protein